mgnify:CR=1 FL=1
MDDVLQSLRIIVNPRESGSGELASAIRSLDEVLGDQEKELRGRLRHFLENRSYAKALVFLEGGEPEKGTCGN